MVDPTVIVCLAFAALAFGAYAQTRVKTRNRESGLPVWLTFTGLAAIALIVAGIVLDRRVLGGAGLGAFGLAALLSMLLSPRGVVTSEDIVTIGSIFGLLCYLLYRGAF